MTQELHGREPVEVRRRGSEGGGSAPEQFLWRGRFFLVRAVLDHWVDSGTWCLAPVVRGVAAAFRAGGEPAAGRVLAVLDADQALVALGDERESWLVEASAGRHAAPGVYELSFDPVSTRWAVAGRVP
jgi:hypothetical protein